MNFLRFLYFSTARLFGRMNDKEVEHTFFASYKLSPALVGVVTNKEFKYIFILSKFAGHKTSKGRKAETSKGGKRDYIQLAIKDHQVAIDRL